MTDLHCQRNPRLFPRSTPNLYGVDKSLQPADAQRDKSARVQKNLPCGAYTIPLTINTWRIS